MILYIPLPLLWSVQLPIRKKLLYAFWLCTGIFIMTATLLRCILCLQDVSQINVGTIWSIRETVLRPQFLSPLFFKSLTSPPVRRHHRRKLPHSETLHQPRTTRRLLRQTLAR
jgi:hypothetical protein